MIPSLYYIKSKHDFGQEGKVFMTKYCAAEWLDSKFGKGGFEEGVARGAISLERVEVLYFPGGIKGGQAELWMN